MADPFSIAGTAVGITSLGLQVCQGLFQYYSQFRGWDKDIDDVLRRVEGLEGILNGLDPLIKRYEGNHSEVPSQLHVASTACAKALQKLEKMTEKCRETKELSGVQDRLRLVRERLLWPFRKDTLLGLRDTLNGFQDNLSLALQSLGLDDILNRLEDLRSTADIHLESTIRVEQHVIRNTALLQSVDQRMNHLSLDQRQQYLSLSADLSTHLGTQLAFHTAAIEQKLDLLISNSGAIFNPVQPDPRFLLDASQTIQDVTPQFRKTLAKYNSLQKTNGMGQMRPRGCTCSWLYGKRQSQSCWRSITLHTKESYTHQPDCPHHAQTDFSKSVEARFNLKLYWLQYYVQAGWQASRDRGWRNIQPILRYRAVVSNDSPVFALFEDADFLCDRKTVEQEHYQQKVEAEIHTILNTLIRSFGNGASPTDVNEDGQTILHVALSLFENLRYYGFRDHKLICSFIDACIAEGVPCDEVNIHGHTIMSQWNLDMHYDYNHIEGTYRGELARAVFSHLARRTDGWCSTIADDHLGSYGLYDTVAEVLSLEEPFNRLGEEDPLLVAILRRSETEFSSQIKKHGPESLITRLADIKYTRALISWSVGLSVLISNTPVCDLEDLIDLLWLDALMFGNPDSIQLLLELEVEPSFNDWEKLLRGIQVKQKEQYRQICLAMLGKYINKDPYDDRCVPNAQGRCESLEGFGLYHARSLSLTAAECLWDAGHRDVDTVQTLQWFGPATPLWITSIDDSYRYTWKWSLAQWLMEKGADITWIHPTYLTTPAHIIGGSLVDYVIEWDASDSLSKVDSILLCSKSDQCTCYCSHLQSGCYVIGCAVRCPRAKGHWLDARTKNANYKKHIEPHVYALVDSHRGFRWMSSAILRVMTFDKLSLTHTCCFRIQSEACRRTSRPTKEEAEEIYDIEREDINLLDTLMAEFEALWDTYEGTFGKFMQEVWKPKMRSIQKEQKDVEEIYQETGVRLRQTEYWSGSDTETSDSEDDDSSSSTSSGNGNRFTTLEDDDSEGDSEE